MPDIELTAHVFRAPVGGWLGLDTAVSFGPDGAGLTQSVVHDAHGPFAISSQSLVLAMQRRPPTTPPDDDRES